jgi:hypothetical protein
LTAVFDLDFHEIVLQRDDFSSNHHPALPYCWSMIFFRKPVSTLRFTFDRGRSGYPVRKSVRNEIGYARVSAPYQCLDRRLGALCAECCTRIFREKVSTKSLKARPTLALLDQLSDVSCGSWSRENALAEAQTRG